MMELHKTSERGLYAHLTKQELSAYRLTFEELNPKDERTEALVGAILTRAERTLGWTLPQSGKLRVDALPTAQGGMLLILTARTAKTRYRVKKQPFVLLCRFSDANAVLSLLYRVQSPPFQNADCRLYRDSTAYVLRVSLPTVFALRAGRTALSEYGTILAATPLTEAYLREYTEEIRLRKAP